MLLLSALVTFITAGILYYLLMRYTKPVKVDVFYFLYTIELIALGSFIYFMYLT